MFKINEKLILNRKQLSQIKGGGDMCADGYSNAPVHYCEDGANGSEVLSYYWCHDDSGEEESYMTFAVGAFLGDGSMSPCIV